MPIYSYRCGACGHERDVLQRLADPVLEKCPECGQDAFSKQLTAPGACLSSSSSAMPEACPMARAHACSGGCHH